MPHGSPINNPTLGFAVLSFAIFSPLLTAVDVREKSAQDLDHRVRLFLLYPMPGTGHEIDAPHVSASRVAHRFQRAGPLINLSLIHI